MKKTLLPFLFVIMMFGVFSSVPVFAQRGNGAGTATGNQTGNPAPANSQTGNPAPDPAPAGQATGMTLNVRLKNPLQVNDINAAIRWFINALLKFALPFIVVFFIISGFRFILARGNSTEITKAKQMFWWTIIGTLLILGAWTITNAIIGTVNSITN